MATRKQAKFLCYGDRPKLVSERQVAKVWRRLLDSHPAANLLIRNIDSREVANTGVAETPWSLEDMRTQVKGVENELCKLGKNFPAWKGWKRNEAGFINEGEIPEWLV